MEKETYIIRRWLWFFIVALVLSGLSAIPIKAGVEFIYLGTEPDSFLHDWFGKVYFAVQAVDRQYPFLFYGYDWLAFAHFVLAVLFFGPLKDPVRNRWVIEFGIIACLMVIPFALIAGHFRGIPFWWRIVDASFGLFGLIPLQICLAKINKLERDAEERLAAGEVLTHG